jgi:cation diffusion facilitator family transporter
VSETRATVLVALGANLAVAAAKGAGGALTGSPALLSEAAHSVADCLNEVFLLLSLGRAERPADRTHPFGYGKERFFWSLLAAVGIFVSGAGFSAYQGIAALTGHEHRPSTFEFTVVYGVLLLSLVLEGGSLRTALRQVRSEAADANRRPVAFVLRSPDPTVKTVASEDAVAVVGVLVALAGTALHQITSQPAWEGVASLIIAALLGYLAFVLGRDTKELLIGESADPAVRLAAYGVLRERPEITGIAEMLTMQLGPAAVLVAARVQFEETLTAREVERVCTEVEDEMSLRLPEVQQVFLDPSIATDQDQARGRARVAETAQEMAELDGAEAVRALRTRTVRRAAERRST